MRTGPWSVLLLAVVAACGGGADSTSPPAPPPPPPGPTPASLTVTAGNGQVAAPSEALAVAASVTITDQNGHALAGVPVTFAVEAGGGTVDGASAQTAADGTARVTSWRLGPLPGENRLRASSGTLAPVSFSATGRLLVPTTPVSGTVVLPTGTHLEPGKLRVESSITDVPVGSDGAFTAVMQPGKTNFAAVHAPNGHAILLGWLDAQHHSFTARSTAEVMVFFDLKAYHQPLETARRMIRDYLAGPADLHELEAAITAVLTADPANVTLATSGVLDARRRVVQGLLAAASAGGPARGTLIDPLNTPLSGISLDQQGFNSLILTNNWRRRVVGFVDRLSYVPKEGGAPVSSALPGLPIELAGVTAATTIVGTFLDIAAGKFAWVPIVSEPVATPLFPADALATRYRVLVVGPGQPSGVVLTEPQEEALIEAERATLILDLVLPFVDVVLTADNVLQWVGGAQKVESLVRDFFDFNPAPTEIVEAIHEGHWLEAVANTEKLLFETERGQEFLFEHVFQPVGLAWGASAKGLADRFGEWQKALAVIEIAATAVAIGQVVTALEDASQAVAWDVTATGAHIALNPAQASISQLDIQVFEAKVLEATGGGEVPEFVYRWSTTGNFGELCAANATPAPCGKLLETPSEKATYAPDPIKQGTDQIKVEVFIKEPGAKIAIGDAAGQITTTPPLALTWRLTSIDNTAVSGNQSIEAALRSFPNTFYGSDRVDLSLMNFNPGFAYFILHPGGVVPNLTGAQPRSVWLQWRTDGLTALDGAKKPRRLARPPESGPGAASPNHALTASADAGSGSIDGQFSEGFLNSGSAACVLSQVTAAKSGTILTGRLVRRYRLTPCSTTPVEGGEWVITYDFRAARLP